MHFEELRIKIKDWPIFTLEDVFKWFPETNPKILANQLYLWTKKRYLERIKRGLYKFSEFKIKDSFILANFIYPPSYISLETALNYYSIIPDIPFSITSLTTKKTSVFKTEKFGNFSFRHIQPNLFFGYEKIEVDRFFYQIALPEKALFDFFYLSLSKIDLKTFPEETRFSFEKDFNWRKFKKYSQLIQNNKFKKATKTIIDYYAK